MSWKFGRSSRRSRTVSSSARTSCQRSSSLPAQGKSPRSRNGVVGISEERSSHHSSPDMTCWPPFTARSRARSGIVRARSWLLVPIACPFATSRPVSRFPFAPRQACLTPVIVPGHHGLGVRRRPPRDPWAHGRSRSLSLSRLGSLTSHDRRPVGEQDDTGGHHGQRYHLGGDVTGPLAKLSFSQRC